jgi:2-polyprenyl-3-methyl-5-hydroxy-6-metoxy-1,4-benzoquinol methylase
MKRIETIAYEIDGHLHKLESFAGLLKEVKASILELKETQEKSIIFEQAKIKRDVAEMAENLKKYGLPQASEYEKTLSELRPYLFDENWPVAIDPSLICDNEEKIKFRANGIIDLLIGERLNGKKFLDFGCGEGHTLEAARNREADLAFGFDVDGSKFKFDQKDFSDNFELVKTKAPFDVILLHDVLDHAVVLDPVQILMQAASVLSDNGRIYVRNHPWCSRHGSHLYLYKNLAFLHLVFDEIELVRCEGLQLEPNIKVTNPIETYRSWFGKANLEVKSEFIIRSEVEEFFTKTAPISERIQKHWMDPATAKSNMEIDFIEYILEPSKESANRQIF